MSTWTFMNIKGQGHSLTLVQSHLDSTFLNSFSLETTRPIEAKFHVEPPRDGEMKVCSNGPGHMTKMATMPIYGKNLKKSFFSGIKRPVTLKVVCSIEYYQICSKDDTELTLTFYGKVKFDPLCFCMGKRWNNGFTESIVVYDIKADSCSQPND